MDINEIRAQRKAERAEQERRDAAALEHAKANPVTPEEKARLKALLGELNGAL